MLYVRTGEDGKGSCLIWKSQALLLQINTSPLAGSLGPGRLEGSPLRSYLWYLLASFTPGLSPGRGHFTCRTSSPPRDSSPVKWGCLSSISLSALKFREIKWIIQKFTMAAGVKWPSVYLLRVRWDSLTPVWFCFISCRLGITNIDLLYMVMREMCKMCSSIKVCCYCLHTVRARMWTWVHLGRTRLIPLTAGSTTAEPTLLLPCWNFPGREVWSLFIWEADR